MRALADVLSSRKKQKPELDPEIVRRVEERLAKVTISTG
jgi:hypothetical protein